ncbi:MAG: glutaredoxin family protein [Deltaproteobacteria bacterium]|nr:glutaredoxin family protein [Deltaproteobacteria bacterium]MBW2395480.1 glutaredoxin family protein [Deltaproteobacteria bacterium]
MRTILLALIGMLAASAAGGWLISRHASEVLAGWAQEGPPFDLAEAMASRAKRPGRVLYQYVDEQGSVQFVDSLDKVPERFRKDVGRIELAAPTPAPKRPRAGEHRRPYSAASQEVVMYSSPGCHACESAARWFDRNDVPYTELNIRSDDAQENLRGRVVRWATPTIDIDGQLVIGFDPGRLEELLEL